MGITRRYQIPLLLVAVFCVCLGALWQLRGSTEFQLAGRLLPRVDTSEKVVALTFDDGPVTGYTEQILGILDELDVNATFFLMGSHIKRYPELTRLIHTAGHEIGNHSHSHPRMVLVKNRFVSEQIERTDHEIRQSGYAGDILFRPPYGEKFVVLPLYLARHDRTSISWDIAPDLDATRRNDSDAIARYVIEKTRPGSIILLHVMSEKRHASMRAVPKIVLGLQQSGYRFVTVSELLQHAGQTQQKRVE